MIRKLTSLEYCLIGMIGVLAVGSVFAISQNQMNKTYLDISLKENKNYLQELIYLQGDQNNYVKNLNNTISELNQLEAKP